LFKPYVKYYSSLTNIRRTSVRLSTKAQTATQMFLQILALRWNFWWNSNQLKCL